MSNVRKWLTVTAASFSERELMAISSQSGFMNPLEIEAVWQPAPSMS